MKHQHSKHEAKESPHPHRKSPHDIEKLNCSSEFFVCRGRETVRGFTSRRYGEWINPLTETHERGREELIKEQIKSRL
jgi:hypothetical protein